MRKQSLQLFAVAMILSVSAAIVSAMPDRRDTFNIEVPFEFQVGDQVFEAGEYQVYRYEQQRIVIQNRKTGVERFYLGVFDGDYELGNLNYALRFHKYGDMHFLRNISARGADFDLPRTKAEKRQKTEMNMKRPDQVMLGTE